MILDRWLRFTVVGILNTALDFGLFNVFLLFLGVGPLVSSVLATSIAVVVAFALHKGFTFRSSAGDGHRGVQFVRFVVATLAGLLLHIVVFEVTVTVVETSGLAGMHAAFYNLLRLPPVLATMIWNYNLYRLWVFPDSSDE